MHQSLFTHPPLLPGYPLSDAVPHHERLVFDRRVGTVRQTVGRQPLLTGSAPREGRRVLVPPPDHLAEKVTGEMS